MPVYANQFQVAIGLASVQLIGSNPRRRALVIGAPQGSATVVAFLNWRETATATNGIAIQNAASPLLFDRLVFGNGICDPVTVISNEASRTIPVCEWIDTEGYELE